jgi:hypothetical protein
MNSIVHAFLSTDEAQTARLVALQTAFAAVCSALAQTVQQTRCWNRVGLHHLAYRALRERFPQMGSQMVCNAIYSVSRTCRQVLQNPDSPWAIQRRPNAPLPLLQFKPTAPVYFDRHTISLKKNQLSMYTLDGRMHFQLGLRPKDQERFFREKLREVVLARTDKGFRLSFLFSSDTGAEQEKAENVNEMPEYVLVLPPNPPSAPTDAPPLARTA